MTADDRDSGLNLGQAWEEFKRANARRLADIKAEPLISELCEAVNKDIRKITGIKDVDMRAKPPLSDDARRRAVEIIALKVRYDATYNFRDTGEKALAALLEHFDLVER